MSLQRAVAAILSTAALILCAACGAHTPKNPLPEPSPTTSRSPGDGSPDRGIVPKEVSTVEELAILIQDAYGDGTLDLHRGHQPVEDVLDQVLEIPHAELHVRMEQHEQNLATVALDLDLEPTELIDAMVKSRMAAIDNLLAEGTITVDQAGQYLAALTAAFTAAFTFRVTWDGSAATPMFSGLAAG